MQRFRHGASSRETLVPLLVEECAGCHVNHAMPKGIVDDGRPLDASIHPGIADTNAMKIDLFVRLVLILQMDGVRDRWHVHAGIGFSHEKESLGMQVIKDCKEVFQE